MVTTTPSNVTSIGFEALPITTPGEPFGLSIRMSLNTMLRSVIFGSVGHLATEGVEDAVRHEERVVWL